MNKTRRGLRLIRTIRDNRMLKTVLIILAVIVVAFVVVVAVQPSDFRVARSATIDAPPDVVFSHVNDLHKWQAWSPWAKLDPQCKFTFDGPASGRDAVFGWSGNNEVGEGKMTIVESRPNALVRIRLDFVKPFAATNMANFTFAPAGAGTSVTWAMTGERNFLFKAVGLFMDCDKMVGPQFEKGLAQLKSVSEASR